MSAKWRDKFESETTLNVYHVLLHFTSKSSTIEVGVDGTDAS